MSNVDALLERVPAYAKDLKLNLSTLLRQTELTEQQIWGTAVAAAVAARNTEVLQAIQEEAQTHLKPVALEAAKSAPSIMGMNNVYYRFLHLTDNQKYSTIPARLRMNVIRTHGTESLDFELWCLVVSAVNNCKACVKSHEKVVRENGLTEEAILAAVRLAAVIHGLAVVFDAEHATVAPIGADLTTRV